MERPKSPRPSKRPAARIKTDEASAKAPKGLIKAVGLEENAFRQMEYAARKLRVSKTTFASAAGL